ncbi:MAG: hypothetical protein K2Y32_24050 [Candidatus Obscuribacterales bacterium]|nr:hypothetical protein [Candidatus Obscuribacterales bacterium]
MQSSTLALELSQLWSWTVLLAYVFVPFFLGLAIVYQLPRRPGKLLCGTVAAICLGSLLWVLFAKQLGSQSALLWFKAAFLFLELSFFMCGALGGAILKARKA